MECGVWPQEAVEYELVCSMHIKNKSMLMFHSTVKGLYTKNYFRVPGSCKILSKDQFETMPRKKNPHLEVVQMITPGVALTWQSICTPSCDVTVVGVVGRET